MSKNNQSDGRVKVAYCKCGKKVIIACVMPLAETDKDFSKDFRDAAKKGRKIDIISAENGIQMCSEKNCNNCEFSENKVSEKTNQQSLF